MSDVSGKAKRSQPVWKAPERKNPPAKLKLYNSLTRQKVKKIKKKTAGVAASLHQLTNIIEELRRKRRTDRARTSTIRVQEHNQAVKNFHYSERDSEEDSQITEEQTGAKGKECQREHKRKAHKEYGNNAESNKMNVKEAQQGQVIDDKHPSLAEKTGNISERDKKEPGDESSNVTDTEKIGSCTSAAGLQIVEVKKVKGDLRKTQKKGKEKPEEKGNEKKNRTHKHHGNDTDTSLQAETCVHTQEKDVKYPDEECTGKALGKTGHHPERDKLDNGDECANINDTEKIGTSTLESDLQIVEVQEEMQKGEKRKKQKKGKEQTEEKVQEKKRKKQNSQGNDTIHPLQTETRGDIPEKKVNDQDGDSTNVITVGLEKTGHHSERDRKDNGDERTHITDPKSIGACTYEPHSQIAEVQKVMQKRKKRKKQKKAEEQPVDTGKKKKRKSHDTETSLQTETSGDAAEKDVNGHVDESANIRYVELKQSGHHSEIGRKDNGYDTFKPDSQILGVQELMQKRPKRKKQKKAKEQPEERGKENNQKENITHGNDTDASINAEEKDVKDPDEESEIFTHIEQEEADHHSERDMKDTADERSTITNVEKEDTSTLQSDLQIVEVKEAMQKKEKRKKRKKCKEETEEKRKKRKKKKKRKEQKEHDNYAENYHQTCDKTDTGTGAPEDPDVGIATITRKDEIYLTEFEKEKENAKMKQRRQTIGDNLNDTAEKVGRGWESDNTDLENESADIRGRDRIDTCMFESEFRSMKVKEAQENMRQKHMEGKEQKEKEEDGQNKDIDKTKEKNRPCLNKNAVKESGKDQGEGSVLTGIRNLIHRLKKKKYGDMDAITLEESDFIEKDVDITQLDQVVDDTCKKEDVKKSNIKDLQIGPEMSDNPKEQTFIPLSPLHQGQNFHFILNEDEWNSIRPTEYTFGKRRKLMGDWTDIFSDKISDKFCGCVLAFKTNRIKALGSRKSQATYFTGKALCKGSVCQSVFNFCIDNEPYTGSVVTVSCTVEGRMEHTPDDTNKRQIKGQQRKKIADSATSMGAVNFYLQKLSETPNEELEQGNMTRCQTPSVIRKVISETVAKEHLHTNVISELVLLKEAFITEEDGESGQSEVQGYIQDIGHDPFHVVLFCKEQIRLARSLSSSKQLDLYIDATGSVVTNIPKQKRPYLYSIVVRPHTDVPAVSIADMISTDHTIIKVEFFLSKVKREIERCGKPLAVRKVECDFSWVFIQSALKTFNLMNIKQYLTAAFGVINGRKKNSFVQDFTVVHLCSAHMIHDFSRRMKNKLDVRASKSLRRLAMLCFAKLQNSITLSETKSVFQLMCSVMGSPQESDETSASIAKLMDLLHDCDELIEDCEGRVLDEATNEEDETWHFDGKSIKEVSPFTKVFVDIMEVHITETDEKPSNEFFCIEILTVLASAFLPILPLWSGILLQPLRYNEIEQAAEVTSRDTNAPVEGWFKAVKKDMRTKSFDRPANFVLKLRKSLKGRLKETAFPHIRRRKDRKDKEVLLSLKKEKWGRKRPKKPIYHSQEKKRKVERRFPLVPRWGGHVDGQTLVNTCTLDNLLTILFVHYKADPSMQSKLTGDVFNVLSNCLQLMADGNFDQAKKCWLDHIGCADDRVVDTFGDEYDFFVSHFRLTFEQEVKTRCSNASCPEPVRETTEHSVTANPNGKRNTPPVEINSIFGDREDVYTDCDAHYKNTPAENVPEPYKILQVNVLGKRKMTTEIKMCCVGKRHVTRVVKKWPPVIFVRVYELVVSGELPSDVTKFTGPLYIGGRKYTLVGATFYRKGHYTAVIASQEFGWLFYDGLEGRLQSLQIDNHLKSFLPCHLVFVLE